MTPNHIPANKNYPGMIRFATPCGRTFAALGDPAEHAKKVKKEIEGKL